MEWRKENESLTKEFSFKNFVDAIAFVNEIGDVAEELGHHPNILIHSFNKVKIMLYTHSENKITEKDQHLAARIDLLRRNK